MTLFVLGLMPIFILLQWTTAKSSDRLFWHTGLGIFLYTPFVVIRALVLEQGFRPDYMTFFSEWWVSFVLDALLPTVYLALVLWLAIRVSILTKSFTALLITLATFFALDNIVFVLFISSAAGAYELLIKPIVSLLLVVLVAKIFLKFDWLLLLCIVIVMVVSPAIDALFFMNRYALASIGLLLLAVVWAVSIFLHRIKRQGEAGEQEYEQQYSTD